MWVFFKINYSAPVNARVCHLRGSPGCGGRFLRLRNLLIFSVNFSKIPTTVSKDELHLSAMKWVRQTALI